MRGRVPTLYGLLQEKPGDWTVFAADWAQNRTVELAVDWLAGNVSVVRNLTTTPFPFRLAVTPHSLAVISMVCCEPWQERDKALRLYSRQGQLLKSVQYGLRSLDWCCPGR